MDASEDAAGLQFISSIEQLMATLNTETADGRESWFRGHRDRSWELKPSVFRSDSHRRAEKAMLARFRQEAAAAGQPYPFDNWGWITFAQHHELPTRLLDWSQSPLVGLFFACERKPGGTAAAVEPDGEFILIRPHDLNVEAGDADGGHLRLLADSDPLLQQYLPGGDLEIRSRPRAVVAPMMFDRIRFQAGTFTVSQAPLAGDATEPLRDARSLRSFVIPGNAKPALRDQLDILGFNDVSIYRDLDRIAKRIKAGSGRGRS